MTGKIELVEQANRAGTPIISCMGAGNKLNAAAFEVSDIYKTSFCPLARVMRYELRRRGIRKLKVVYSREQAMTPIDDMATSCRQNCICPPGTAQVHPETSGSGQHGLCACRSGTDRCRRGRQGSHGREKRLIQDGRRYSAGRFFCS